jgi:hypothetical protein
MCASCGCDKWDGADPTGRHITMSQLVTAAEAAELTLDAVAENIGRAVRSAQLAGSNGLGGEPFAWGPR